MSEKAKDREEKIRLHCSVLAEVILAIRPVYLRAAKPQQALLETMIGAAIWYIPKPVDAWTGRISKKALAELHPDSGIMKVRLSEEHVYPRKIAAKRLIQNNDLTAKGMESIFREEYGRLHYITPEENKAAIRFQRSDVFSTPEEVYRQAGIELVSVERTDLRAIKKRDRDTIEKYTKSEAIKSVVSIPLRAPRFTS
ncbi:MAG: hypothetical protein O3C43_22360 [Verrucomicrobia bacterium]|nr:hypothetical protein [Verrucomicrobiota bacterium]MDA1069236.1 hypothetical protein [Verrucomicrobiota bacterium]